MLRQAQEKIYKDIIYNNYHKDPASKDVDSVLHARVDEVIDALALGCTLAKPRRFGMNIVTAEDFRSIARKFDSTICAVACDALYDNEANVRNRKFYLLGVLARFRDTINPKDVRYKPIKNHNTCMYPERRYTQDELASYITNINDLTDDDI